MFFNLPVRPLASVNPQARTHQVRTHMDMEHNYRLGTRPFMFRLCGKILSAVDRRLQELWSIIVKNLPVQKLCNNTRPFEQKLITKTHFLLSIEFLNLNMWQPCPKIKTGSREKTQIEVCSFHMFLLRLSYSETETLFSPASRFILSME